MWVPFKAELADRFLGTDINLGGDPRSRSERMGKVRPWRRNANKGCVIKVAASASLPHLRKVQNVCSNRQELGRFLVEGFVMMLTPLYRTWQAPMGESLE